ncbi:MAG: DUF4038 domain-containing protein [Eubacteriales bacterium]
MNYTVQNQVIELAYLAEKKYKDPFNEVTLDVRVNRPDGIEQIIPAFWAGGDLWRLRFASSAIGSYTLRTECSDTSDNGLHGQEDKVVVLPYKGDNIFYKHGPLKITPNSRIFTHEDGTPFFWLADTWWMGLTKRLTWPNGFQTLALDRVEKGFNVVQIVAGLYPDMPSFDERGANEAGFPWEKDFTCINPDYFDMADRRIQYMTDMGLLPCIVGCWGYYLPHIGIEKMKQHWRYLIARYGAYPVVWCLAGEWDMPFYLAKDKEAMIQQQREGWTDIAYYLKQIDGFKRPMSVHEGNSGRNLGDGNLVDFLMLQTGHGGSDSLPNTVKCVTGDYVKSPTLPVIDSEVCYEGIGETCRQEIQRMMFWTCLLSGAAGHTYGANGIWQVNTQKAAFGPSPHGLTWGNTSWEEAYRLPGSSHVALGKRIIESYPWWQFTPHPEWAAPHWTEENYFGAYAAGIPEKVRVIYFPGSWFNAGKITNIEPDVLYYATLINPTNGEELYLGSVVPNEQGEWDMPLDKGMGNVMPIYQDWLLILDTQQKDASKG